MKTNFKKQTLLVLTNEDDKVIAIIDCESGELDILDRVQLAVKEEFDCDEVVINAVLINGIETLENIGEYDYNITFKADIISSEYDTDNETFSLIRTEKY